MADRLRSRVAPSRLAGLHMDSNQDFDFDQGVGEAAFIKPISAPCKAAIVNGGRFRNFEQGLVFESWCFDSRISA